MAAGLQNVLEGTAPAPWPVSQQPPLPLTAHHGTAGVCKVDDIWSFGLNQAAFGNYLSWYGADSEYFSNLYLGTSTEKPLKCIP